MNNDVNSETKKSALQLMDGGPSKINQPNSHPSNQINKAAMSPRTNAPTALKETVSETKEVVSMPQHEINKTAVIVGVVGVVALLFIAVR